MKKIILSLTFVLVFGATALVQAQTSSEVPFSDILSNHNQHDYGSGHGRGHGGHMGGY